MKNIKPLHGNVIIKLKETMNNRTESGLYKDTTFDVHAKMMITAQVVATPEVGDDQVIFEVNQGQPRSKEVEPIYIRGKDTRHNIKVDDRIYFHYLTLEDEKNLIVFKDGWYFYKVTIFNVFLSMRPNPKGTYFHKGESFSAHMHGQYVLGTPYWGEGWEEIEVEDGKTVGGKVNSFGLVTETKDIPLENCAVITDIGAGIKPYSRFQEVKVGDAVLLTPKCEFVNEVEGKERWVFTHTDIFAVMEKDGFIRPVCDNVLIKLKDREYKGKLEVDVTKLPLESEGTIVSMGEKADDELFEIGDSVKFFPKRSRVIDDKYAIVPQVNIMAVLKYSV